MQKELPMNERQPQGFIPQLEKGLIQASEADLGRIVRAFAEYALNPDQDTAEDQISE